ncbi:MAG: hypothetical protein ACU0CO_18145 [Shimia sp.]
MIDFALTLFAAFVGSLGAFAIQSLTSTGRRTEADRDEVLERLLHHIEQVEVACRAYWGNSSVGLGEEEALWAARINFELHALQAEIENLFPAERVSRIGSPQNNSMDEWRRVHEAATGAPFLEPRLEPDFQKLGLIETSISRLRLGLRKRRRLLKRPFIS